MTSVPEDCRIGDAVRILDGPFANFVGVVRVFTAATGVVTVGVGVKGRDVAVEVDRYRVEHIR
jgi:transcription antitermination factor NusG